MNGSWIKEQFQEKKARTIRTDFAKIDILKEDVIEALKKIGRKKAPSVDGMMDIIFEPTEWDKIPIDGYTPFQDLENLPNKEEAKLHRNNVRRKLAIRIALYLNEAMKGETLPF